jgi:antitoxin (DNA-binding transcriptional repressor) of toxin-antitoxin stability system
MKTAAVRQFRNRATSLLKQGEPIIVTRHGKIVGFFLPTSGKALALKIRQDLFSILTDEIRASMKNHRLTEDSIYASYEKYRRARGAPITQT